MERLYNLDLLSHLLPHDRLRTFISDQCCAGLAHYLQAHELHIGNTDDELFFNNINALHVLTTALHATAINALIENFLRKNNINEKIGNEGHNQLHRIFVLVSTLREQLQNDFHITGRIETNSHDI